MPEEFVKFPSGDLILEGYASFIPGRPVLVICHPHPLYGGSMDSSVVLALRNAGWDAGLSTLRFNFRGTGESNGTHSGGAGELTDARNAIRYAISRSDCIGRYHIAGYSFGSHIALQVAYEDNRVESVIAIATPSKYDYSFLRGCSTPKLIILGEFDHIAIPQDLRNIFKNCPNARVEVLSGANHFFAGQLRTIRNTTAAFLKPETAYKEYCGN